MRTKHLISVASVIALIGVIVLFVASPSLWNHRKRTSPVPSDSPAPPVSDGSDSRLHRISAGTMFNFDSATIRPEAYSDLDQVGELLACSSNATARIETHTDRREKSKESYNKRLSQRRAEAVKMYFVAKFGIDPRRLEAVGCGFDSPLAPNDPVSGNSANRRVDIYVDGQGQKENAKPF